MPAPSNARARRRSDAGFGLTGAVVMATVLGGLGAITMHTALGAIATAHHVTGEANVHLIEQAAEIDQIQHGTDAHVALVAAAASCACAVDVDPAQDVLIYRAGDQIVSVDVTSGIEQSRPAGGTDLPVNGPPAPVMTISAGG